MEFRRVLFRSLHEAKGLRFEVDAQPDLPAVLADHDRIVQVLINLISNAVKFTPQGSIRCEARRLGVDLVEFAVVDTGIGIARDERASVFEKFRQVGDTLTDKPKRSEEHTSELQSLMRISYDVFCLKKKTS